MCRMHGLISWTILVLIVAGCGSRSSTAPQVSAEASGGDAVAIAKTDSPAAVVFEFLEAVRTGNDEKAMRLLSAAAREKTAALNRNVTPPASDTAQFTVGKVEYLGEDGARVACTWTDIDADGQPKTDEAIWVVRLESDGWRIAGVAAMVFPGEPPLLLNFEDPEAMFRKQQWIREEIRRRMEKEQGDLQARGRENQERSVRH